MTTFNCIICKYSTNIKCNFQKHKKGKIHKQNTEEETEESKTIEYYKCKKCNKKYRSRSGLWSHSNKCKFIENSEAKESDENIMNTNALDTNTMNYVINTITENNKKLIEEVIKNHMPPSITTNNNTNIYTIFLEEKCDKAVNFSELLRGLSNRITIETMKEIVNEGYLRRVSDMIVEEIDKYPVKERPLHYIRSKEENTVQVRENDKWNIEKEGKEYITSHCIDDFDSRLKTFLNKNLQKIGGILFQEICDELNLYNTTNKKIELLEKLKEYTDLDEGMVLV
jgi:hypothetical protein